MGDSKKAVKQHEKESWHAKKGIGHLLTYRYFLAWNLEAYQLFADIYCSGYVNVAKNKWKI